MWAIRNRMDRSRAADPKKFTNRSNAEVRFDDLGGNNRNEYRCHASFGCDADARLRARVQPASKRRNLGNEDLS